MAVELELAFAIWLFAGLMPRLTYLLSLLCFGVFAMVSASKWYAGAESCHCFGAVTTPPIFTMLLDLTIIGLLIVFRPRGMVFQWTVYRQELLELKRFRLVGLIAVIWLVLAVPATHAMMSVTNNDLTELGTEFIGADGKKKRSLQPMHWIGKPFPLNDSLDTIVFPSDWGQGEWTVLLHHQSCSVCEELLRELAAKVDSLLLDCLAVIEVPDGAVADIPLLIKERAGLVCSLRRNSTWFTPSPVVLTLVNGNVTKVQIGISAQELLFDRLER